MTRIIAGAAGGRRLDTPPGAGTRPTSDRVREALFSRLEHLDALRDARVLDLYAGSGALGLEALSRGAASVVLVESVRRVAQVARGNARRVLAAVPGVEPGAVVVCAEPVLRYLRAEAGGGGDRGAAADLVFIDPPYDLPEPELGQVLAALAHRHLRPGALVVVERSTRSPEPRWPDAATGSEPAGLRPLTDRAYGETRLWFAEFT